MKMTKKNRLILKHLRNNARMSFSSISENTGIPVTTVFDNYHRLMRNEVITRHTSLVDFKKLGFHFRSFVFVKTRNKNDLFTYLKDKENVNSIFRISNYDYMIDVVCPTIKEFYLFIDDLRDFSIIKLEVHNVIEQIKKEEFFCE